MHTQCPNCKSTRLNIMTRKSYLLIAFLFLIASVILFLISQFMPGLNHYGVLFLAVLSGIVLIGFIFYLILAAMQLSPTYQCRSCGYRFW